MKQAIKILDTISKDEELQAILYEALKWRSSFTMVRGQMRKLAAELYRKHGIEIEEYT